MADYSKDLYDYQRECMKNCSAFDDGYNKALDDLWKLVTSKYDEVMDFQDLDECIKELKKLKEH